MAMVSASLREAAATYWEDCRIEELEKELKEEKEKTKRLQKKIEQIRKLVKTV